MLQKNIVPWGHGQFLRGSLSPSPMTQSCYVAESSGRCACIWPAIVQAHKESKLLLINTRALCNCLLFHGQWQSGRTDFPFPWYGMAIRRNKTFMVLVPIVLDLPHLKQKKKKRRRIIQFFRKFFVYHSNRWKTDVGDTQEPLLLDSGKVEGIEPPRHLGGCSLVCTRGTWGKWAGSAWGRKRKGEILLVFPKSWWQLQRWKCVKAKQNALDINWKTVNYNRCKEKYF